METFRYLPKVKAPIYIFHGIDDELIPYENSVRLNQLLKSKGSFYPLKDQGHIGMNENSDFQKQLQIIVK